MGMKITTDTDEKKEKEAPSTPTNTRARTYTEAAMGTPSSTISGKKKQK